jgi:hypothetical protein
MLLWPAVSALGLLVLVGLVIVLGLSSTARYEADRATAPVRPLPARTDAPAVPGERAAGPQTADAVRPAPAVHEREPRTRQAATGSVATLPQVRPTGRPVDGGTTPLWWLVTEEDHRVVAGPFPDRVEAGWAAVSGSVGAPVHAVYGVRGPDAVVRRRQTPEELSWLAELGDQLDRLPQDWDEWLTDEDPTVTLVVEVAALLVESGVPLHDCAGGGPAGGVCLTPAPGCAGVLVSWHQHDRMSCEQVRGAEAVGAVQQTMNAAVAAVLEELGYLVAPVGASGCSLVIDARTA